MAQVPSADRTQNTVRVGLALFLLIVLFLVSAIQPAAAQFRDVAYTLEPSVSGMLEADGAAVERTPLYGGALGLSFGRRLQVSGEYLLNTRATSNFSEIEELSGLLDRNLDLRRYGGRVRINLLDQSVLPYLTGGTGVLEFNPNDVNRSRTMYALGGVGLTFESQNRYRLSVGGEMIGYRYDPGSTFLGVDASEFEGGQRLVRSPSVTASLSLYLGGRSLDEQTIVDQQMKQQLGGGLGGVRLFVNPFYGRLSFNDALGFPKDQNLTGVNAGLEFGPYVGLRGFYWRGATGENLLDEFGAGFEGIELYGSELRLRLNAEFSRGFVPYTTVGGGYLNVLGGYQDDVPEDAALPNSRFFGLAGGGLEVPITRSLKVSGGVRSLLTGTAPDGTESVDQSLYGSLMYSAGIEFRLGGGRTPEPPPSADPRPPIQTPTAETPAPDTDTTARAQPSTRRADPASDSVRTQNARLLAQVDSLEQALTRLREQRPAERPSSDSAAPQATPSNRTMTVPVPESGEIYVRFGDAPATTPPSDDMPSDTVAIERRVRDAVRRELRSQAPADTSTLVAADIERIVRRALQDAQGADRTVPARDPDQAERESQRRELRRMEEELAELRREVRRNAEDDIRARREAATRADAPRTTTTTGEEASDDERGRPFYEQALGRPLTYVAPVVGLRAGGGLTHPQIGVRADYRTQPSSRLHIMPELALGLGRERTGSFLISGAYSVLEEEAARWSGAPLEPYVGAGLGLLSNSGFSFKITTNVMVGTSYRFRNGRTGFVELSTLGLFDTNRLVVGYRFTL